MQNVLSKFGNMKKGQSHVEAAPFCDKLVFNKVATSKKNNKKNYLKLFNASH